MPCVLGSTARKCSTCDWRADSVRSRRCGRRNFQPATTPNGVEINGLSFLRTRGHPGYYPLRRGRLNPCPFRNTGQRSLDVHVYKTRSKTAACATSRIDKQRSLCDGGVFDDFRFHLDLVGIVDDDVELMETSLCLTTSVTVFPYPEFSSSFIVSAMIVLLGSESPSRRAVDTDSPKRRKQGFG